ncbi:hypothetical protein [Thalassobacillus devorans]|uniref:hypothetical protein n=1 Tax=Thalassobacillus devorans TaxID=279813 RepID=UPI0015940960|nr:hypothetical protein [Thalassobacillus devorans]
MIEVIKKGYPYVFGALVAVIVLGLFQDGPTHWGSLVRTSAAGLIGTFIGLGLKKFFSE